MKKNKSNAGAKKKCLADFNLPSDWKEDVLRRSAEGKSEEEIYLDYYRINPHMFEKLCEREEEFRQTVKKAERLCKGWWIKTGRERLKCQFFQSAVWFMNMKNRFGWKDRSEVEHDLSENVVDKFLMLSNAEIAKKINDYRAGNIKTQ
jgi:hypothetical protein